MKIGLDVVSTDSIDHQRIYVDLAKGLD